MGIGFSSGKRARPRARYAGSMRHGDWRPKGRSSACRPPRPSAPATVKAGPQPFKPPCYKAGGRKIMRLSSTLLACLLLLPAAGAAEDFYAGKSVALIIGSGEGAGYDLSGRLVAQHLRRFLPGAPI